MDGQKERVPAFDRFLFIAFGALIAYLLFAAAGVYGQNFTPTKSDSTLPVRVEEIKTKSCKVSSLPAEPGKATGYRIDYSWTYNDPTWPEGKDWEMVITPPGISTEANQKYRRKANTRCLDWMDSLENEAVRIQKQKLKEKK